MTLKAYNFIFALIFSVSMYAQNTVSGVVVFSESNKTVENVDVYDKDSGLVAKTNAAGYFEFETSKSEMTLVFFSFEYEAKEISIYTAEAKDLKIALEDLTTQLSEVEVTARKQRIFELKRLKDVEGTAIYAGKKTEVILVDQSMANLASNNARQIFSQVAGLNIYQNDDAGLQLNIGGRGLDPNRTANFNTRQNGYDISADVLGYPESYYTPASEALSEIQVIRGAASLQYGTQFGGLINFKMKSPNPNKPIELITRNTLGSFGLYTNFTSLSGTKDKFSYYTFLNYKKGEGFRPNSAFESKNVFTHLGYAFSDNTRLEGEFTYMNYLAKQSGGLTDTMFDEDPMQSNRTRNWFEVNWLLYNIKLDHKFSEKTNFTFSFFGLDASRNAVGFRGDPYPTGLNKNPITIPDIQNSDGTFFYNRDVIRGDFNNWGAEARLLSKYTFLGEESAFLIGSKYYHANNSSVQGAGSKFSDADFTIYSSDFPDYPNESSFNYPNRNLAIFGENIFRLSDKFTITPGFRFEYIKTESDGVYYQKNYDNANNIIASEAFDDDRVFDRAFILLGVGTSYKPTNALELYGNLSQNYRSVTFSDIRSVSPTFIIDPDITDEEGLTLDIGLRGKYNNAFSYDIGVFTVNYNGRIGNILDDRANWVRTNAGDALIYGVESFIDWNVLDLWEANADYRFNLGLNLAYIDSEYTQSKTNGVKGNKVEFIPEINLKTTLRFGYKNLLGSIQYTYLSEQYTDAFNSKADTPGGLREGVIGEIPAYDILDVSLSYSYKRFKFETGINNLLDNSYFTRRATGYPGPGIIPSAPRNWYATLEIKI
ncbi:TonB-dependent receptor domain-containing protein [Pseudotamlana carrageenivorans]|uniref:TonB-dependent receptor n=1 Tax=Pseudotamlana carrageenivorans TaxID=2069432 RepID=A0A2I7SDU0_9FLAO|nr:TonB-dependent receptor [Tamlana carrageenivorans]AUS04072.1 TonB-dependent receptor [Tamlana carrageenivorans]